MMTLSSQMFAIYIKRAAEAFGITHTREIYEKAIEVLPDTGARCTNITKSLSTCVHTPHTCILITYPHTALTTLSSQTPSHSHTLTQGDVSPLCPA